MPRLLLIVLPAWLLVSGVCGVWWLLRRDEGRERREETVFARPVDGAEIGDLIGKIAVRIGSRGIADEVARTGLNRAAALIDGTLGPSNTGYQVRRWPGPEFEGRSWSLLECMVPGQGAAPGVWLVTGYDAPAGSPGRQQGIAAGLAATIAVARELVGEQVVRPVHLLFVPHAFEADAPVFETAVAVARRIEAAGGARQVLCVDSLGAAPALAVSSRDTTVPVADHLAGLGEMVGAEEVCLSDDFDLASVLFETGLPAARVTTAGPAGEPQQPPVAEVVAAAAGRLAELVRRLAESK